MVAAPHQSAMNPSVCRSGPAARSDLVQSSDPRGRDQSFARAQATNPIENKLAAAFPAVFRRIDLPCTVIVLL